MNRLSFPTPPFSIRVKALRITYRTKIAIWGFLFTAPAVAFLLVFSIFPITQAFFLSFTDYNMIVRPIFVGIKNYFNIFTGDAFPNSLWVSVVYVFGTVIPVWFLSFGLALLLSKVRALAGL